MEELRNSLLGLDGELFPPGSHVLTAQRRHALTLLQQPDGPLFHHVRHDPALRFKNAVIVLDVNLSHWLPWACSRVVEQRNGGDFLLRQATVHLILAKEKSSRCVTSSSDLFGFLFFMISVNQLTNQFMRRLIRSFIPICM